MSFARLADLAEMSRSSPGYLAVRGKPRGAVKRETRTRTTVEGKHDPIHVSLSLLEPLKVERKLNKTAPVRILGERGPFPKSSVKMCLRQRFRRLSRGSVMQAQTALELVPNLFIFTRKQQGRRIFC